MASGWRRHGRGSVAFIDCDSIGCDESVLDVDGDMRQLRQDSRAAGWSSRKVGLDWEDYCEACTQFRSTLKPDLKKIAGDL